MKDRSTASSDGVPEGYHKAMRMMEITERFAFPLIWLVDTPDLPGRCGGAAPPGRRDRALAGGDVAPDGPDGRLHHR